MIGINQPRFESAHSRVAQPHRWSPSMRTPFKVSLVAACGVFLAALLAALFHHNTINGHTLTPLEQLPEALVLAVTFSALALLGAWLGMRRGNIQYLTYRAGLTVALLYVAASFLANTIIY